MENNQIYYKIKTKQLPKIREIKTKLEDKRLEHIKTPNTHTYGHEWRIKKKSEWEKNKLWN